MLMLSYTLLWLPILVLEVELFFYYMQRADTVFSLHLVSFPIFGESDWLHVQPTLY